MSEKNLKGTPTDLSGDAVEEIWSNLRRLLADVFALYVKTKNFHWFLSQPSTSARPTICRETRRGYGPYINVSSNGILFSQSR
jgi:hypothetical protein